MKIFNKQRFLRIIVILILLFAFILISAFSYVSAVSRDIANSVFRLHVIANSDSIEDQSLKLEVRDALLDYMNKISINCKTKNEVINLAMKHKDNFIKIAEDIIIKNGFNYLVEVDICNSYFPTKTYGDLSFPVGMYDCLKIKIGNASGKNWWCVMFPPLCFVDVSTGIVPNDSKEQIRNDLIDEEFNLICNSDNQINFKFKLVELFQNLKLGKNN